LQAHCTDLGLSFMLSGMMCSLEVDGNLLSLAWSWKTSDSERNVLQDSIIFRFLRDWPESSE
jgi:hypothetical protein